MALKALVALEGLVALNWLPPHFKGFDNFYIIIWDLFIFADLLYWRAIVIPRGFILFLNINILCGSFLVSRVLGLMICMIIPNFLNNFHLYTIQVLFYLVEFWFIGLEWCDFVVEISLMPVVFSFIRGFEFRDLFNDPKFMRIVLKYFSRVLNFCFFIAESQSRFHLGLLFVIHIIFWSREKYSILFTFSRLKSFEFKVFILFILLCSTKLSSNSTNLSSKHCFTVKMPVFNRSVWLYQYFLTSIN